MPLYEVNGKRPQIGNGTWIAPSAEIIGDVVIGAHCYIGFGAIVRGDFGRIMVGNHSLVEEAVVIHCADKVTIGDSVIIGHKAMLHDTTVGDHSLIGMQSMLCEYSTIKEWAIVAEQSLVRSHQVIPAYKIFGGSPAREVGTVTQKHQERLNFGIEVYGELIKHYLASFKVV
jgi:carbonic anhydrase/acetyltransferase-like protein (isoleucine patch superfamily)